MSVKSQDRYRSGRFRVTTYVCFCGSRSEGALNRDMHGASHMQTRPGWYARQVAKQRGSE